MNDEKIIELYFARSEQAIAETKTKYNSLCMKIAHGVLLRLEDCEECVNTSYLKLWNAIPPKRPNSLCGYLCRTVRNTALSECRKAGFYSMSTYEELDEAIPSPNNTEDEYDSRQFTALLNEFLGKQKQKSRDIFVARYFYNASVKEIAMSFGLTESAVLSSLLRTRGKLKKFLTERGVSV